MQIRGARDNEAAELSELVIASKRHRGYVAAQMEAWRADLTITAEMLTANPAFVAELEDRVAGFYAMVSAHGEWELVHCWVLPEFMNRGVGRAMLAHARDLAATAGAAFIAIDSDPNAEPFYLACGATRTGVKAAPIAGQPDRVRPQLVLPVA
ncbi:MAG: GNAT family N-acetyltransferase [Betaproteobacteria bacterium]